MHETCWWLQVFVNLSNLTEINWIKFYVTPVFVAILCHVLHLRRPLMQNMAPLPEVHKQWVNIRMSECLDEAVNVTCPSQERKINTNTVNTTKLVFICYMFRLMLAILRHGQLYKNTRTTTTGRLMWKNETTGSCVPPFVFYTVFHTWRWSVWGEIRRK